MSLVLEWCVLSNEASGVVVAEGQEQFRNPKMSVCHWKPDAAIEKWQ
jgi:hypothetical protein